MTIFWNSSFVTTPFSFSTAFFGAIIGNISKTVIAISLSFAAGAMIYVVVEELIPEMSEGNHTNSATIAFMIGFAGMMILDIAFG